MLNKINELALEVLVPAQEAGRSLGRTLREERGASTAEWIGLSALVLVVLLGLATAFNSLFRDVAVALGGRIVKEINSFSGF